MTAVRIAHADPSPGRQPVGLVVLADDAGHRALPVRLPALAVSGACSPAPTTATRNTPKTTPGR